MNTNIQEVDREIQQSQVPENDTIKPIDSIFTFNGYSNQEIIILFLIALFTSVLFILNHADLIFRVNILFEFYFI